MKRTTNRKGFTLIELIVTIVILGILAALAVPAFQAVIDRSRDNAVAQTANSVAREIHALAAFDDAAPISALADAQADVPSGFSVVAGDAGYTPTANTDDQTPTNTVTDDVVFVIQDGDADGAIDIGERYVEVDLGAAAGVYTPVASGDVVEHA